MGQAGTEPDLGGDLPDDLGVRVERGGRVGEHVRPGFQLPVVHAAAAGPSHAHAADRRGGVGRVVTVPAGRRLAGSWRRAAEAATGLEVETLGPVAGRRPGTEVPPGFLTHDVEADG